MYAARGLRDVCNRPSQVALLQLAGALHEPTGSLQHAFSPDPGSSCQSRHKSSLPPVANKQIHTTSLETDAKTLAHASIPKQNQAGLRLSTTITQTHTRLIPEEPLAKRQPQSQSEEDFKGSEREGSQRYEGFIRGAPLASYGI